jgi:hypothetical protein
MIRMHGFIVWLKFAKFEKEFEKNLKRKTPTPFSPLPFSFGPNRPFSPRLSFLFPQPAKPSGRQPSFPITSRAYGPATAQPACVAAQPPPFPFSFPSVADRWGPAVRLSPTSRPRVSRAFDGRRPLPAGLSRLPRLQTTPSSRSKAQSSLSPHQSAVSPLNPSPTWLQSRPVRHGYPWVPTDQGPRGPC